MRFVRWVALAVGAAVGWVTLSPAPAAYAGLSPVVEQRTSDVDASPSKSVTVECPNDSFVFALGGEVKGGGGDVFMTGLYPGAGLRSATVVARARLANPAPYAITVSAICQPFTRPPDLVMETVDSGAEVTARCSGAAVLFGLGYRLEQPPGAAPGRVDALVPDASLRDVWVHASGVAPGGRLTAVGICYEPHLDPGEPAPRRVEATTASLAWPKSVSTQPGSGSTFGVGGLIQAGGPVHLDALVQVSSTVGGVRAARASSAPGSLSRVDDEAESLTAYAIRGGTFH